MDEVFLLSGMKRVAEEEGAGLVKFTTSRLVDDIPISRYVFNSDCIISIPKLKTHSVTIFTAALKNTFGTVVGLYKTQCHVKALKGEDFAKIIAKVHSISRPHLTVLDGIVAMEGDGPASGSLRDMNIVMAGRDAVAVDSCIAKIIGLEPLDIPVTKEAYEMGIGEADPSRIEVVGDDINSFISEDFKLPQTLPLKLMPKSVLKGVASLMKFKPYITSSICTRCNLCKVSCPVDAITIEKDSCYIDYKKCIRCMCCHEVCPYKAISIKKSLLTKLVL